MPMLRRARALRPFLPALLLPLMVLTFGTATAEAGPAQIPGVQMVEAWPDVEFKEPVDVAAPKDGSNLVFVGEQKGTIQVLPKYRGVGPVPKKTLFLDIRSKCWARSQGGLLSIAFHPKYKTNGLFYVSYTAKNAAGSKDPFALVVSEFRGRGMKADAGSERELIRIGKGNVQHQAGGLRFGPDGMLFIGVGDGKEPDKSQSPRSYFGKMLRIDPTARTGGLPYGIPQGNPWPNVNSVKPEIWAFGLRNPWRFGWDMQGRLIAVEPGTSGPESREWVIQVKYGANHGWPFMEGTRQVKAPGKPKQFVPPTFEYVRGTSEGATAGVGGVVYRGDRIKSLRGKYLFGDYMRGEVYCIDLTTRGSGQSANVVGRNFRMVGECPELASIGEDAQGELYFCANDLGLVFTLAPDA